MNQQAFKLNTRLATGEKEYLIQTINDSNSRKVLSSLFSDGELLDTFEEHFDGSIKVEDLNAWSTQPMRTANMNLNNCADVPKILSG